MSDDLDFDMEVIENDDLGGLGADAASSSKGNFRTEETTSDHETENRRTNKLDSKSNSEEATFDNETTTDNSEIEGWSRISLGEFASFQNGNAFSKSDWGEEGYPIIRIQNLTGEADEYNHYDGELEDKYRVDSGDTLLTWSGTIGVFKWNGPVAALNQHIFNVETKGEVNDSFFHFKLEELIPQLEALSHGSTMKHVRKADLVNIDIELPPLREQRKIASVLYTVDQAIQKTEAIIEQAKRVKRGLVEDIMTRGIGHDRYKKVHLGPKSFEVPASWKCPRLEEITYKVTDGAHITPNYVEEGIPFLSTKNIDPFEEQFDFSGYERYVTEEDYRKLNEKCDPDRGDVLICRRATIGPAQLVRTDDPFSIFVGLGMIKPRKSVMGEYLEQFFNWEPIIKMLNVKSPGSTMKTLNLSTLRKQRIPLPPLPEQEELVDILSSVDEEVSNAKDERKRLERIKKGLMQNLLTGEIRTEDKTIEV